jgi:dCMP deaminase
VIPAAGNVLYPHEAKWLKACDVLAPIFSTCAKRQYFAVVLAPNKRVAGVGYNGSPPGMAHCVDGACPRLHENAANGSNYDSCISQHAEAGALLWSDQSLRQGGTLIVNGPPCMGCAKLIASSGVSRLACYSDSSYGDWNFVSDFLVSGGITVVERARP